MTAPTTPRTRVRAGRRAVHGKGPREDGCTCGELPASHLPGCPVVPLMTPAGRKLLGKTLGLRILPEEVEAIEQQAAAAERERLRELWRAQKAGMLRVGIDPMADPTRGAVVIAVNTLLDPEDPS